MANAAENSIKPFEGNSDRYNGVTVVSEAESCALEVFPSVLQGLCFPHFDERYHLFVLCQNR